MCCLASSFKMFGHLNICITFLNLFHKKEHSIKRKQENLNAMCRDERPLHMKNNKKTSRYRDDSFDFTYLEWFPICSRQREI